MAVQLYCLLVYLHEMITIRCSIRAVLDQGDHKDKPELYGSVHAVLVILLNHLFNQLYEFKEGLVAAAQYIA